MFLNAELRAINLCHKPLYSSSCAYRCRKEAIGTWCGSPHRDIMKHIDRTGSGTLQQVPLISIVDDGRIRPRKPPVRLFVLSAIMLRPGSAEEFLGSDQLDDTACLITDVQMPGLSGVELQDRLISDGHDMPTIFVSAYPDTRLERQVIQSGAIAYLRKPFKENHLVEHIGTALRRRRGRRA